jgi:hypothetical protein
MSKGGVSFKNYVELSGNQAFIITKLGKKIIIDTSDAELIMNFEPYYNWCVHKNGYAYKYYKEYCGKYRTALMHRLIMHPAEEEEVDHINRIRHDNRRENLRICSSQENAMNRTEYSNKTSIYKGVSKKSNVWHMKIKKGSEVITRHYTCEIAAANAYNHLALRMFGEFAKLNDVPYRAESECEQFLHQKSSKYIGVCKQGNAFVAFIHIKRKNIYIGRFSKEEDAAKAFNGKAIELHGISYKKLNEIDEAT